MYKVISSEYHDAARLNIFHIEQDVEIRALAKVCKHPIIVINGVRYVGIFDNDTTTGELVIVVPHKSPISTETVDFPELACSFYNPVIMSTDKPAPQISYASAPEKHPVPVSSSAIVVPSCRNAADVEACHSAQKQFIDELRRTEPHPQPHAHRSRSCTSSHGRYCKWVVVVAVIMFVLYITCNRPTV